MDILTIVQTGLSLFFLITIAKALLSSLHDFIHQQQVMQGEMVFLLYSMLVYYSGFRINILFWDTFINEPIRMAYGLVNLLTTHLLNVSIAPPEGYLFFMKYLIPAIFIYYFIDYWLRYSLFDARISKMISFMALVMFYKSNLTLGLINFGLRWTDLTFAGAILKLVVEAFRLPATVLELLAFGEATANPWVVIAVFVGVGFIFPVLLFMLGRLLIPKLMSFSFEIKGTEDKARPGREIFMLIFFGALLATPVLITLFAPLEGLATRPILQVLFYMWLFVSVVSLAAVLGEAFFIGAMAMFASMMRTLTKAPSGPASPDPPEAAVQALVAGGAETASEGSAEDGGDGADGMHE